MPAVAATDFFLALCDRAANSTAVDIDILAVGEALGIHSPIVFAYVHELTVRGWIEAAPADIAGRMRVRLTAAGASRSASERMRRSGMSGRDPARGSGRQ